MNEVVLIGRITKKPRTFESQTAMCRFTVAVDRLKKGEADFIGCIAFGKTAEAIEKYTFKGQKVAVQGRVQTGSYKNKNGETVFTTDIVANRIEFLEWKDRQQEQSNPEQTLEPDVPESFESIDEDVPF